MTDITNTSCNNNEIDLVDLIVLLWKRKWIVVTITALITVFSAGWFVTRPDTYTAKTEISIGKVAGTPIDALGEIRVFQKSFLDRNMPLVAIAADPQNTAMLTLSASGNDPQKINQAVDQLVEKIISRDQVIYQDAATEVHRNANAAAGTYPIDPKVFIKSYTYPTTLIKKEPALAPDPRKTAQKIIVAAIAGLFLGIFLVFALEYGKEMWGKVRGQIMNDELGIKN